MSAESVKNNVELERKESIMFKGLGERVRMSREFVTRALNLEGENISGQLDTLLNSLKAQMKPEELAMFFRHQELESMIGGILGQDSGSSLDNVEYEDDDENTESYDESLDTDEDSKEKNPRWLAWEEELESLNAKDKAQACRFLERMTNLTQALKRKNDLVPRLLASPVSTWNLGPKIEDSDVISINSPDPYTIVVHITPEGFTTLERGQNNMAYFVGDTPVCVIKGANENTAVAVRHERIHVITDSVVRIEDPVAVLHRSINSYRDFEQRRPEYSKHLFKHMDRALLDSLQGELVASVERAMDRDFTVNVVTDKYIGKEKEEMHDLLRALYSDDLIRFQETLSTAGVLATRTIRSLLKAIHEESNSSRLAEVLSHTKSSFENMFVQMGLGLNEVSDYIKKLPIENQADAREECIALLCFLLPHSYKHAPAYMKAWAKSKRIHPV